MANTDKFYTKETILLDMPKGRDVVRVMIGEKTVRGEQKMYLDIRAWYMDDSDQLCPGKGFAKPMTKEEILNVATALESYASEKCG